jgi:hypothetical protein
MFTLERNQWLDKRSNTASRTRPHLAVCGHPSLSSCQLGRGCLHTLHNEELHLLETGTGEMMNALQNYWQSGGQHEFWDRQENAHLVNAQMVRLLFCLAINAALDRKENEDIYAFKMLRMYGMIKCGSSSGAVWRTMSGQVNELVEETTSQVSFRPLCQHLKVIWTQHASLSLVYILNELSPCNCLQPHANHSVSTRGGGKLMLTCSSHCGNREESREGRYACCSKCRLAVYCSRTCQLDHWHGTTTTEMSTDGTAVSSVSHKKACNATQELASFLRGGSAAAASSATDEQGELS